MAFNCIVTLVTRYIYILKVQFEDDILIITVTFLLQDPLHMARKDWADSGWNFVLFVDEYHNITCKKIYDNSRNVVLKRI